MIYKASRENTCNVEVERRLHDFLPENLITTYCLELSNLYLKKQKQKQKLGRWVKKETRILETWVQLSLICAVSFLNMTVISR